jgi:hypothetical protein
LWHKNNHLYKKFPKTWNESFCHVGTINERDIYHKMKALIVLWTYCFLFNSGPFDIHFISRFTVGQGNHSIGITSSICHGQVTAFYYPEITNCEKRGLFSVNHNWTFIRFYFLNIVHNSLCNVSSSVTESSIYRLQCH